MMLRLRWESQFRDTEAELWAKIPSDWQFKTIEEVKAKKPHALAMGPFGSNITTDNFVSSGIPVIRGVNLTDSRFNESEFAFLTESKADQLKSSNAFRRDIVITHRGTLGQLGIIPQNSKYDRYVVSQSQMKLSCDQSIVNPYFVFYFLKSQIGQYLLLRSSSPTGVPSIAQPLTSLKAIPIPLPDLAEQDRITSILFSLDELIENKEKQNEVLEKAAIAVFKKWFVDFAPFKDSEFVPSELGDIPKEWYVGTLKDVSQDIVGGLTPLKRETKYWDNATVPWLTNKEVAYGRINFAFDTEEKVSSIALEKTNLKLLPEDCLMISFTASVGKVAINKVPMTTNQQFISFIPKTDFYLYYTALYFALSKELIESYSGATPFDYITMERALQIPVLIPPPLVLQEFNELIYPLFQKIALNQKAIRILRKIRDVLLPLLVFGRLRVEEI